MLSPVGYIAVLAEFHHLNRQYIGFIWVLHAQLNRVPTGFFGEEELGLLNRHIDKGRVILTHANVEDGRDGVIFNARGGAKGGRRPLWRDELNRIPRQNAQGFCKARAHSDLVAAILAHTPRLEVSTNQIVRDDLELAQI